MLSTVLIITAIFLILRAFYKWATVNNDFFEKRNIKYLKPTFLLGYNVDTLFGSMTLPEFAMKMYNAFPNEPFNGVFSYRTPQYFIRDPELIQRIFVKDFTYFEDRVPVRIVKMKEIFCNILTIMESKRWRLMRPSLSPTFTGSKIRQMFGLMLEGADNAVNHLTDTSKDGDKINIEMKDLLTRCTSDIVASCAFGLKLDSIAEPNNEFYLMCRKLSVLINFKHIFKMSMVSWLPRITKILNIRFDSNSYANIFKDMVLENIKEREKNNIHRPDMINILMQIKEARSKQEPKEVNKEIDELATVEKSAIGNVSANYTWSDDEIMAQVLVFSVGGLETTSSMITFAVYELVLNPIVQQNLYDEIAAMNEHLCGKPIDYEAFQKLKYLDQVCSETLRKWTSSSLVLLHRQCTKDYVYDNGHFKFEVKKGHGILVPLYAIHHDPEYFPEPEKFDPERFSDANKHNIKSGTYIPFGVGPRNCLGSRFAILTLKAVIYTFVLNFSIKPNDKFETTLKFPRAASGFLPTNGIHVELKPRNNKNK